ncbi:uncharacterized protein LOC124365149 [Homalodisca vitripennis]|uniref:uncharacterized protein LOC124365149 n=1 Tax=Homalodisca vitripennis TaxID=197043 RepID=UPI001EEB3069|nr:uncharacterized protein LOC124365149 [Homalodisca vitripennis]
MTLLPSLSVVLALCIALGKVWRRGLHWCHRLCMWGPGTSLRCLRPEQPQWTSVYKAISVDSGRSGRVNFPSLQERNVLYVEKEIEEARVRGEADDYEVSYSRLALGRQIGKGAFGRVFSGQG